MSAKRKNIIVSVKNNLSALGSLHTGKVLNYIYYQSIYTRAVLKKSRWEE